MKLLEEEKLLKTAINREIDTSGAKVGYIEIYPENLATKGLFYKEGFRIFIRAAYGKEVKHWATIDNKDPIAVDESFNYILSNCCEVRISDRRFGSYKDIDQQDRLQVILAISELTYPEAEAKIETEAVCPTINCQTIKIQLRASNIKTLEVSDKLIKYYDADKKIFIFNHKDFGEIEMSTPTIGLFSLSLELIKERRRLNKEIDAQFFSILPYLFTHIPTKEELKKVEMDFLGWTPKKLSFYISIIEELKFLSLDGNLTLKTNCDKCGSEVTTNFTFPDGLKCLFIVSDWSSELL